MDWSFLKMLFVGLVVGLVANLMIPKSQDGHVSRPTIAIMGLIGAVAGHYAARRAFGVTYGLWGLVASAVGAVVVVLVYLLVTPEE